jgi:CDP-diglyceride synthetase
MIGRSLSLVVHVINAGLMILIFIGFPAITGWSFGSLRFSDQSIQEQLTVTGLAIGVGLNVLFSWFLARGRSERRACVGWALLFGVLLLVVLGHVGGWLHFDWLKRLLLWGREQVAG